MRILEFDTVSVDWVTFRPDPDNPGKPLLSAYGSLINPDGISVPRQIEGWDGVSVGTRSAVEQALMLLEFEVTAHELALDSGDGLVVENGQLRQARADETPVWTKSK